MRRVKRTICALCLIAMLLGVAERAQAEESLGSKIKKIFAPTPTPPPRKHHKSSTASKKKEDAEKPASPKPEKSPSPAPPKKHKASPTPKPSETPEPSVSASPKKKKKASPTPTPESSPKKKHKPSRSPTPEPAESPPPSSSPVPTPETSEPRDATPSPSPSPKKKGAPATIAATGISEYEDYPPNVRKMLDTALELTTRNLGYKYGSADPATGGMDCSGFVFYVLTQNGIRDVPRDSSQQYVWVRKSGNFKAVNSRQEDTFELDELVPGDLLFWIGTYSIARDPPITHAMIYLGREKGTNHRIMAGASDGRTYKGESRYGVSVFDFKIPRPPGKTEEGGTTPSFIGYGHVPGL